MTVLLVIAAVVALFVIVVYNGLVSKRNQVENASAGIDTLLKKRFDLIPNLIATVQAYMGHERGLLTELTELRAKAMSGRLSSDEQVALDRQASGAIGGLMVAAEAYPDLKASSNFTQLQASMNEIEEQISAARRFFNSAVTAYNDAVEMFPGSLFAGPMGMRRKALFEIAESERANVNARALFKGG